MAANKNEKLDVISDVIRDILDATDENLRSIPVLGLVRDTPLAVVNRRLNATRDNFIDKTVNVLGDIGSALGVSVDDIKKETVSNIKGATEQFRLKSADKLRKDLFKATQTGIDKQPKVVTKSGRRYDYKAYTEMNIRTTLAHELSAMQLEFGGEAGVVFYLCNVFEDAADDHAPFQGKYYYDERFKTFGYDKDTVVLITKTIRDKKIAPLQYVQNNKPFLGTRPNCRHTFTPVSIEQVTKVAPAKLSKELGTTTGTYKDAKYEATQNLRTAERHIRDYKYKAQINKELAAATTDKDLKAKFQKVATHNTALVKKWRGVRNKIVDKNEHLSVDYRRESVNKVLNDLGISYSRPDRPAIQKVFNMVEVQRAALTKVKFDEWLAKESERLGFDFLSLI